MLGVSERASFAEGKSLPLAALLKQTVSDLAECNTVWTNAHTCSSAGDGDPTHQSFKIEPGWASRGATGSGEGAGGAMKQTELDSGEITIRR